MAVLVQMHAPVHFTMTLPNGTEVALLADDVVVKQHYDAPIGDLSISPSVELAVRLEAGSAEALGLALEKDLKYEKDHATQAGAVFEGTLHANSEDFEVMGFKVKSMSLPVEDTLDQALMYNYIVQANGETLKNQLIGQVVKGQLGDMVSIGTDNDLADIVRLVPGLMKQGPGCPHGCYLDGSGRTFAFIAMHLNDTHHLSREDIVDWLEEAGADLTVRVGEEVRE